MPSSRGSSRPRDRTYVSYVSCIAGGLFTTSATWEAYIHKVGSCKDTEIHTHTQTHNIYIPSHLPTLDLYLFNVKLKGFDSMVFNVYD